MREKPPPQERNKIYRKVNLTDLTCLTSSNPNSEASGADDDYDVNAKLYYNIIGIRASKDHMLRILKNEIINTHRLNCITL